MQLELKMANVFNASRIGFLVLHTVVIFLGYVDLGLSETDPQYQGYGDTRPEGVVHFNNPKLLPSNNDEQGYWIDPTQEEVDPLKLGGIHLRDEARKLTLRLKKISNEEMGVTAMQGIYDSLVYTDAQPDYREEVRTLVEGLERKLEQYMQLLNTNKATVENLYRLHLTRLINLAQPCSNIPSSSLQWSTHHHCDITEERSCDLLPHYVPHLAFNPGRNLTEVFQHNLVYKSSIKWQYFITTDGIYNIFPAYNCQLSKPANLIMSPNIWHRDIYINTVSRHRKHIVIVMDHGNSLSPNQFTLAKSVAKTFLRILNEEDLVGFFALSTAVAFPEEVGCMSQRLLPLTPELRENLFQTIEDLSKVTSATNHSLGLHTAFRLLHRSTENFNLHNEDLLIAYISRGLLSSLTEARDVLNTIATENGRFENRVIINTYAVIDAYLLYVCSEGKPIMYEKSFLQDVADQNFTKYVVEQRHPRAAHKGRMEEVNSSTDLPQIVSQFYEVFNRSVPSLAHMNVPTQDMISGNGEVVSLTLPCLYDNQLLGVVGMDLHLGDLVEGVTYHNGNNTQAFLVDLNGYVVMHPSMQRPFLTRTQPMRADIAHYEKIPGFYRVREKLLSEDSGQHVLDVPEQTNSSHSQIAVSYTYTWQRVHIDRVELSPFVLVIKAKEVNPRQRQIRNIYVSRTPELVYHRLDLLPTDNTCLHLKQLATLETSSLFLAAQAFQEPFLHLSQPETKRMVQGYLAYLNDDTDLISNPGIKEAVQKDVLATSRINSEWKQQYVHSQLNDYIPRRFVASPSGVFRMFPGTHINKAYDPTRRSWYNRALEHPDKVVLTAPYLDSGGAGYIVTISHTIYEGKHSGSHGPEDPVVAIMGIDVTLKYFYKILTEQLPQCKLDYIRCFLMDDRGYLIAHRDLVEATGRAPSEEKHVTHKEPLAANDILNHKGFVRKKLCNSYTDHTVQRFYQFNTSLDGIITNLVHGEHCARYQITPVSGTNVFLGIVNVTCSKMRAFCPCSMVDRLCLNCQRMEQTECECPCECPLQVDFCDHNKTEDITDITESCERFPEEPPSVDVLSDALKSLPQCYQSHCTARKSKMECLGVLDCEWCERESDGVTLLHHAFCSTQRVCYAGVLGAPTPYGDHIKNEDEDDDVASLRSAPVGPVAGGIMGCFLFLALGVYCYRHHVHRHSSHQYVSAGLTGDANPRTAPLDNEMEELHAPDDPGGAAGHTNIILASFENPASISPYRMNTSYRRPTQTESDLGYSTMTPQDDSEQASTTCVEPLIISRDRYRPPPAKTVSGFLPPPPTRRSRSPSPPLPTSTQLAHTAKLLGVESVIPEQTDITKPFSDEPPPQTQLPNQVIANVQVHMVDSH